MSKQQGLRPLLHVGDVVQLNSGSPEMTVIEKMGDDIIVARSVGDELITDGGPEICFKLVSRA